MNGKRKLLLIFYFFASGVSGCIWVSVFASIVGIPIGIVSSAVELKMETGGTEKLSQLTRKRWKKHYKRSC